MRKLKKDIYRLNKFQEGNSSDTLVFNVKMNHELLLNQVIDGEPGAPSGMCAADRL